MSVVVAVKHNGIVYLGADSQISSSKSKFSFSNVNNYKIWRYHKFPESCLFGGVGSLRDINLIKVSDGLLNENNVLKGTIDFKYIVENLVDNMFDTLRNKDRLVKDSDELYRMSSGYLFSFNSNLYEIGSDGSVIDINDFTAIGSGQDIAIGSLNTTEEKTPVERIVHAIEASCKTNLYVNYPIIIMRSDKIDVLTIKSSEKIKEIDLNF
jgi:ATP-dependent protease HslVU (ClpYQ) peptidase subunit